MNTPFQQDFINVDGLYIKKAGRKIFTVFSTATTTMLYCPFLGADGATGYQVPAGKKLRLLAAWINQLSSSNGISSVSYGDTLVTANGAAAPTNEAGFGEISTSVLEQKSILNTMGQTGVYRQLIKLPEWEIPALKYPYVYSYNKRYSAIIVAEEV